jgi:hypothetical protein
VPEGSSSATCPEAQNTPPTRRGLRCRHVPHGTKRATHQEMAPVSPRAPRHRARHPLGEGSSVATCLEASSPSSGRRRLRSHHVPRGSRPAPCAGRLWHRHVIKALRSLPGRASVPPHVRGSRLASWCGRAPEPSRAQWLSAPGHTRAFSGRMTSDPS